MITAKRCASTTWLFHAAAAGDLHRPGLELGPLDGAGQHDLGRLVEHDPHHLVSALRYGAGVVALARLMLAGCKAQGRPDRSRVTKTRRHINGGAIGWCRHRTDTEHGHRDVGTPHPRDNGQHAAMQHGTLLAQRPPGGKQRGSHKMAFLEKMS